MKLISWNVNGIRACLEKGFLDAFAALDADFFCLQETKAQPEQVSLTLDGYEQFWYSAEKKGYSGTAIFAKEPPISVTYGVGVEELDHEGRLITLEYPEFYLLTCYTPNAQDGLKRLDHRMEWEDAFRAYLQALDQKKPVIVCGDLNVAHQEIDLKNPKSNRPEKPEVQSRQRGLLRRRTRKIHGAAGCGLYRYIPRAVPRFGRGVFVVELPLPCATEQRRLAYRLFFGVGSPQTANRGSDHPQ